MPSRDPGPFVILRARLFDRALWFEYRDSRGETRSPGTPEYIQIAVSAAGTSGWPGVPFVWAPSGLDVLLKAMIDEAASPQQIYKGPVTVPVFAARQPIRQQLSELSHRL